MPVPPVCTLLIFKAIALLKDKLIQKLPQQVKFFGLHFSKSDYTTISNFAWKICKLKTKCRFKKHYSTFQAALQKFCFRTFYIGEYKISFEQLCRDEVIHQTI